MRLILLIVRLYRKYANYQQKPTIVQCSTRAVHYIHELVKPILLVNIFKRRWRNRFHGFSFRGSENGVDFQGIVRLSGRWARS